MPSVLTPEQVTASFAPLRDATHAGEVIGRLVGSHEELRARLAAAEAESARNRARYDRLMAIVLLTSHDGSVADGIAAAKMFAYQLTAEATHAG